jgi:hypothetical protein
VGKAESKSSLGRCRRRWEDNFTTGFTGTGSEDVEWIYVDLDTGNLWAVMNKVMKLVVVKTVGFLPLLKNISFL